VRARLGWGTGNKRDVNTNAERLPTAPDLGERPPITDALTVARAAQEVRAALAAFPAEMRAALELWSEDTPFDEIARRLDLPDASRARNLVRAAQARLRERFRDRVPELFG
jgi:DNA-directed RNA polymerase specialized sigma24 family protein